MLLSKYLDQYDKYRAENALHDRVPTANEPSDGESLFRFYFGAYGETVVDVFADHLESALECAQEWLDDNAPGHLVSNEEFAQLCKESAEELGHAWPSEDEDVLQAVQEHAEIDLTMVGHTTLKHGQYHPSHEWTVDEL